MVKPVADEDFYALYSDIVDGFVEYGTREDFLQIPPGEGTSWLTKQRKILDRADDHGTSSHAFNEPDHMGWRDDVILIRDGRAELRRLPRADVRAYLQASRIDSDAAFNALEREIDDDEPPIQSHTIETLTAYRRTQNGATT
ncbi:hypothetical protein [Glycomyces sp. YM15]|uniref:hypothetical protein n=1 Tax=Glycomyces sp. YM15 TaxID=2800446 RepID=UPI0019651B1D|nr:hypothetical protein [Glycomyces sp. YM15]